MEVLKAFLKLIYNLILAFPRLFAPIFASIPLLAITIKFLPEIVGVLKGIHNMVDVGYKKQQIQQRVGAISSALQKTDRRQAAQELKDALTFGDK